MDLLCDTPTTVVLTPDTTSEQAFLPEPASLRASLLLADHGYLDLHYLRRLQDAGGFFIIRAKAGMNPQVVRRFAKTANACARCVTSRSRPSMPTPQASTGRTRGGMAGGDASLRLRLLISWNCQTKEFCYLLTNLLAQRYPLDMIYRAYKWRWQVELHCLKNGNPTRICAFDTENPAIVEGLIWTAIAAAALKRFLAHMTQLLLECPCPRARVAMCAVRLRQDCPGFEDRGRGRAL